MLCEHDSTAWQAAYQPTTGLPYRLVNHDDADRPLDLEDKNQNLVLKSTPSLFPCLLPVCKREGGY
jgi:hypothetical protein